MNKYNSIRWNRLKELGIDFKYIKKTVKNKYDYEIKEKTIDKFIEGINNYKDINEIELLNIIEDETYKKASIFSIVQYKKNKNMPIIQDMTSMLNAYFIEKNEINIDPTDCNYELDEIFRVTEYIQKEKFAVIKLARRINVKIIEPIDDGTIDEDEKEIYDCCKFYIDIVNKLIIMFFNDIKESDMNPAKEITYKKSAFRSLFDGVTNKNMVRYFMNEYLEAFFKEYMKEYKNGENRKLISIIEATSNGEDEERSLIRSVKKDFIHNKKRLEAIEYDIENEGLNISEIECCIKGNFIDIKMGGEITCINTFLYKEVIEDVCKEFFEGYTILQ